MRTDRSSGASEIEPLLSSPPSGRNFMDYDYCQAGVFSRAERSQWRGEDQEQRLLDNARVLWERFVDDNRREVDQRTEQLRGTAFLAALVAGFVMMSFVQFEFDPESISPAMLLGFGITNSLTVALNTCCMAMCSLILASAFKTYTALLSDQEESAFLMQCREFARRYRPGDRPPEPRRNFRNHWDYNCEAEWRRAILMFHVGIAAFLVNIGFAAFIHFQGYQTPAILAAVPMALGLVAFYVRNVPWIAHLLSTDDTAEQEHDLAAAAKPSGLPFDWHLPPAVYTFKPNFGQRKRPLRMTLDINHTGALSEGEEALWRAQDMQQRALQNARVLWNRFVKVTRTNVEERAEMLRSFSFLSGILASFAVSALLQLTFDPTQIPRTYQLIFGATVGLTAGLATCSMTMCSLIMLSILRTGRELVSERQEAIYLQQCRDFAASYVVGDRPPQPRHSFRAHWEAQCEPEWRRAFYMFSTSLVAFIGNVVFSAWVKYWPTIPTAIATSVVLGGALLYLVWAHGNWVRHLIGDGTPAEKVMIKASGAIIQSVGLPFDWHLAPTPITSSRRPTRQSV